MKSFVILLILIVFVMTAFDNNSYGLWVPQSSEKLFEQSETMFVGIIESVNPLEFERSNTYEVEENGKLRIIVENYTQTLDEYTVDIEEFLKNPLESSTITMLEATVGGVPGRSVSIGGFETGDRVLFYIPKLDGTNQYSPESFLIPEQCDAKSVIDKPRIIGVNDFTIMQNDIPIKNNFTANQPIEFVFNKDMRTLDGSWFEVNVGISKVTTNNRQIIFEETIRGESLPCEWIATVSWDVVLDEGKYRIDMYEVGDLGVNTSSWSINVVADSEIRNFPEPLNPDPLDDLWNKHAEIIDGTIVSKTIYPGTGKGPTEFHVKINKFFKPLSKNTESITLFASFADSDIPAVLNEGDKALIYIEPGNQISRYSVRVDESTYCEPRDYIQIAPVLPNDPNQLVRGPPSVPFDWNDQCVPDYYDHDPNFWVNREYKSPLHQWKVHNIPIEEQRCSGEGEDYVSGQKKGNHDYKYCIQPTSYDKLVERGWAKNERNQDNTTVSFSFCGADGFDSKGNLNTSNSTHHWDENECQWYKIAHSLIEDNIYSLPFGWIELDYQKSIPPIYTENPNNPNELILDVDVMVQVQKILDKCDYVQKLESGEIPWRNSDGSFNVIRGDLPFFNNGTHYIDSDLCNWIDSFDAVTYNCFEAKPTEQNWYSGPAYFDNGTHHINVQKCKWIAYSEEHLDLPLCDPIPEQNFGKCREFP